MSFKQAIRAQLLSLLDFTTSTDWTVAAARGVPVNALTGEAYKDVNMLLLWKAAAKNGYKKNAWMTYEQVRAVGAGVEKNERATLAIGQFLMDFDNPDLVHGVSPVWLFNVDQIHRKPKAGLFLHGFQEPELPFDAPAALRTLNKVLHVAATYLN